MREIKDGLKEINMYMPTMMVHYGEAGEDVASTDEAVSRLGSAIKGELTDRMKEYIKPIDRKGKK
jgi:hypothetical protein